jgi:hypothetical protein
MAAAIAVAAAAAAGITGKLRISSVYTINEPVVITDRLIFFMCRNK